MRQSFLKLALWALGYYKDPEIHIPQDFSYPNCEEEGDSSLPHVTWLGHSTFLIEAFGIRFLTDPVWSQKLTFLGPKRLHKPPLAVENLPPIDYVILSHNHYDHLDKIIQKQLAELNPQLQWIVPKGLKSWFKRHLKKDREVIELEWADSCIDHRKEGILTFTATFAKHWSGRFLWDNNSTSWMGVVVEIRNVNIVKRFYFAGDTAYDDKGFQDIGQRWKKLDLALLPIGAYSPREVLSLMHINPAEAVSIHKEVHSQLSVAGHFGTYKLSSEKINQPPYELFLALQKEGIPISQFRVLKPGQVITW